MIRQKDTLAHLTWLRTVKRASTGTLDTYGYTLSALRESGIDSTLAGLESFICRPRRSGRPAAAATMAREVAALRSYFGWLHKRGVIAEDPTQDLVAPAVHNLNPKPISDEVWLSQWRRDLSDAERLLLGLPFFAGLRRVEVGQLLPHHVCLDPLAIVGFERKGGGDDVLHLGDVLEVWRQRLPHLYPDSFEHALRRAVTNCHPTAKLVRLVGPSALNTRYRAMGVPWSPHQGRHSFVTNLLRAGLPLHIVSRLCNHASVQTTMRYTKVSGTDVRDWLVTAENRGT